MHNSYIIYKYPASVHHGWLACAVWQSMGSACKNAAHPQCQLSWGIQHAWEVALAMPLPQVSVRGCLSKSISLWNIDPSLGKRRLPVILMPLTSSWCTHSYLPQHLALWCQRNASFFKKTLSHLISALKNLRPLLLQLKTFLFLFASHLQMLCCLSTHTHFEVLLLSSHWYTSFAAYFQYSILFSFVANNYNFDFCSLQHYNISFIYMQQLFQMTSKSVQARYSLMASWHFPALSVQL